jgi:RNA polymerase-binding transcription factor DksA
LIVAIGTATFYRQFEAFAPRYDPSVTEIDATETDLQAAEHRLDDIEAALERLEQGSYGRCASCGSRIGDGVLDDDPLVTTCEDCKSALRAAAETAPEAEPSAAVPEMGE